MYNVLNYNTCPVEEREWSKSRSKVGNVSLFRSGNSLYNTHEQQKNEVKGLMHESMKGAVVMGFGDCVRAENEKKNVKLKGPPEQPKHYRKTTMGMPQAP